MAAAKTLSALNRLFMIEHRSLATYLADACPWTHPGDEPASAALVHILADQQAMSGRIGELIDARNGRVDRGSFPMEYTDMNMLSLDFLVQEMIRCQKRDIAEIERIVTVLAGDREARELAEEVLGCERAHLEVLEDLAQQPAQRDAMRLFDSHAHLNQTDFDADRADVVARAKAAGVAQIVTVGYNLASSRQSIEIAAAHPGVFASVGIQPNDTIHAGPEDWDQIVQLAAAPRVVALGETGLDRYWDTSPLALQQDYFDRHLRLSQQTGLPFIVHTRESDAEVLEMLRAARSRGELSGVMHSFSGTAEAAAECVVLGLYVSFAGMATFKKSDALRAVAATIPLERILIETDAPYLSPHPLRGKRNEPSHLVHTAACVAAARGVSINEFAAQTTANARRLFSLSSE